MNTFGELIRDTFLSAAVYLFPRLSNVLVFILIARLAGPAEAGLFTLSTTYLIIFTTIMRGMDELVIRQVSQEPTLSVHYLINFLILRLGLSVLAYGVLWFVVRILIRYEEGTAVPILVLSLSLIPDSLTLTTQAVWLGQRRFGWPFIMTGIVSLLKVLTGFAILASGGMLDQLAWVWVAISMLGMVIFFILSYSCFGMVPGGKGLDWELLRKNWGAVPAFLIITALLGLETQLDTILLSVFCTSKEVGLYGAAATVVFGLTLFSQSYRMSIYPLMVRYAKESPEKLLLVYDRSFRYLGALVLPMTAGVFLMAPAIISILFGPNFKEAVPILETLVLTLVFLFLNVPNARLIYVHNRQGVISVFLIGSLTSNIVLNLILDPFWGPLGAAVARCCSSGFFFFLSYLYVYRTLIAANIFRLLAKPSLATLALTAVVWPLRTFFWPIPVGAGLLVYVIVLWFTGGILSADRIRVRQFVMNYLPGMGAN